ncbi:MAG: hypothetical protein GXC76_14815 [Rhodanobacteraceae bacterium]|jgi:PHD/YefM family antitoxin component YafN of YafNO toxin-antitoxin module|nr:hypothetical protein [Rhodanobacteraceae bacterium]
MTITTLSSGQFNQYAERARKAAEHGPVFITDHGRPTHALLSSEPYQQRAISALDRRRAQDRGRLGEGIGAAHKHHSLERHD